MAWLVEQAVLGRPNQNFWWVSPIREQARIPFVRVKRGLPQSLYIANESAMTISLANGAILWFKGADHPDSLYGDDVFAAVIDEASRCKAEAWHAVRSTLTATHGPMRIIGNVRGRRNWAYELARRAEAGEPNWHYAKITAYDAIAANILSNDEIEDARRGLPDAVFRELYLAEPSEDGSNPFGLGAIKQCLAPLSTASPDQWGIDLAKSVDWTVLLALDKQNATCRFDRFQLPWPETTQRILSAVGRTPALVDSTGVGDPVLEGLQRPGASTGGRTINANYEGYKFTAQSKQQLMEGLAVAIQQQEVRFPDGAIRAELEAFEFEVTRTGVKYSAPDGVHDDTVCALALAVRGRMQAKPMLPMGWLTAAQA